MSFKRKFVSRIFLNLEKLLLTLGIKTTKKLVAMLVYLSKEYIILLYRYTNIAAMTSHENVL